ncbi:hypothetical protein QBC37DRAFT_427521 [Rhypophila decipiens]|uniref:ADP-ribose 1''-phosphate phosphatase n=1 Tax=Rhypophila decipiens TaxID=261697 RepID=A0AAN6Y314_9PEZI|nr:hypothetical protein QBC37DRAFT_427521 [Rhypophila decipiens]
MASKRTADGFKKASLAGGERKFKQTKLNFGSSSSTRAQRPIRQETQDDASSKSTPSPQPKGEGQDERQGQGRKEGTEPARDSPSPSRLNFNMEASKENRPPSSPSQSRPPRTKVSSSEQPQETPTDQAEQPTQTPGPPTRPGQLIRITDIQGDLFSAPPNTVLIHACNAIGSWGGGIALAFRKSYPEAFKVYNAHCKRYSSDPRKLVGTALLIPPPPLPSRTAAASSGPAVGGGKGKGKFAASMSALANEARKQHWIGCLFTSKAYGKGRDSPRDILRATSPAMGHLMRLISKERTNSKRCGGGDGPGEIRMCQINSGLFDVPWKDTKRVVAEMTGEDALDEEEVDPDKLEEVLRGLGDLPVHVGAYWRDM